MNRISIMKRVAENPSKGHPWALNPNPISLELDYVFVPLKNGEIAPVLRGGMADIATRELGGTIASVHPVHSPSSKLPAGG
jgi:hypothetical protein